MVLNNPLPTVFILQEVLTWDERTSELVPKYNFSSASSYGRLKVILPEKRSILVPRLAISDIQNALKDFGDEDYILPVGNPVFVAVVGAVASDVNDGRFKVLAWEKRAKAYIEVQIEL